jgi:hypothetical protein
MFSAVFAPETDGGHDRWAGHRRPVAFGDLRSMGIATAPACDWRT